MHNLLAVLLLLSLVLLLLYKQASVFACNILHDIKQHRQDKKQDKTR